MHFEQQHTASASAAVADQEPCGDPQPTSIGLDTILQFQPPASRPPQTWEGVFVAELTAVNADGQALLSLPEMPIMPPARSTVALGRLDIGRQAAVMFEQGDVRHPLLIGWMNGTALRQSLAKVQAHVDDDRLELSADREIVLRCGRASLTLTRSGKVLIRGAYVSSRSSGANCIKGGSVQIN